jgi:hypothetical protein
MGQHTATPVVNDTSMLELIGCAICTGLAFFVGRDPAIAAAKAAKERGETVPDAQLLALTASTTNRNAV